MPTTIPPLIHGNFYHVYNRGNNRESLFPQKRNYTYFMNLWWKYVSPIADTWAYCLLQNHFHSVVYIKDQATDLIGLNTNKTKEPSRYFSNFFNAYTRGLNIAVKRTGALFERPFKRIPVNNTSYLMQLIVYVHQNPQKHQFTQDFREWNYSSYHEFTSDISTRLQRDRVLRLFGSKEDFIRIHQEIQPLPGVQDEY